MKADFEEFVVAVPYFSAAVGHMSMDIIYPFYRTIGLTFKDTVGFQAQLRLCLRSHAEALDMPFQPPQYRLASDLLNQLGRWGGDTFAKSFWFWALEVYLPISLNERSRNLAWMIYADVLKDWTREFRAGHDPVGFGIQASTIASILNSEAATGRIAEQIREVRSEPLTEWDSYVYRLMRFDNDEERVDRICEETDNGLALRHPFRDLADMANRHRFQLAWEELLMLLDTYVLDQLYQHGLRRLSRSSTPMSPLPRPLELRREISWDGK